MRGFDQIHEHEADAEEAQRPRVSPGKRTLTQRLPARAPVEEQLDQSLASGGGAPLPASVQSEASASLGADFGNVRVHTDADAASMASGFGYRAFSYGSDLFFGGGQYQPESPDGRFVLMHELSHVAQTGGERAGGIQGKLAVGASSDAAEVDADRGAAAVMAGASYSVTRAPLAVRGFGATGEGATHENQTMTGAQATGPGGAGFSERDAQMIYSGNWMRDMNQFLIPKVQAGCPAIYEVLNIAHTAHFGFPFGGSSETAGEGGDGSFRAAGAAQEFGTYDPVEHIDNPGGLAAGDVFDQAGDTDSASNHSLTPGGDAAYANVDPRYIAEHQRMVTEAAAAGQAMENPTDNIAHQVDQSGVPVYIATSGTAMKRRFEQGAIMANQPTNDPQASRDRALRYAGEALHIMQDYYAHSNFCEIAMNLLMREGTKTLGDDDADRLDPGDLVARLRTLDPQAGTHNLDTYVHRRDGGADPDAANRDVNATTGSGREVMATGTFTIEDTLQSIKEKIDGAVKALDPFSGTDAPSEHALAVLGWLESNPEYVGDTRTYIQGFGQILDTLMPIISGAMRTAGLGAELAGDAEALIERNVGGGARRAWHTVAGGVTDFFGGDSSGHDRAAANADRTAAARASAAEGEGREVRQKVNEMSTRLETISAQLAAGDGGLRALYRLGWEANELVTLEATARRIPIIGPEIAPHVKKAVDEIKDKAKKALKAIWEAAVPQIIAEFNAAVALALGDTEVQRSDQDTGGTTSSTFTQPTHTDIAKDFHSEQHGTADTVSVIEEVGEFFHRMTDGARAVRQGVRDAYSSVSSGNSPAQAVGDMLRNIATSGNHNEDEPHAHQHRHGGAWLQGLASQMATASTQAILARYRQSIDGGWDSLTANVQAQNREIDNWYRHPADCRASWESSFAAALRQQPGKSNDLLAELARRSAQPPSVQAPNDQQYSDSPEAHDHHTGEDHADAHPGHGHPHPH